jgi:hypothetical protein
LSGRLRPALSIHAWRRTAACRRWRQTQVNYSAISFLIA